MGTVPCPFFKEEGQRQKEVKMTYSLSFQLAFIRRKSHSNLILARLTLKQSKERVGSTVAVFGFREVGGDVMAAGEDFMTIFFSLRQTFHPRKYK